VTIGVIPITGVLSYDYFFTLVFVPGLMAIGPAMIFKLLRW
jgi:hypothetical protein